MVRTRAEAMKIVIGSDHPEAITQIQPSTRYTLHLASLSKRIPMRGINNAGEEAGESCLAAGSFLQKPRRTELSVGLNLRLELRSIFIQPHCTIFATNYSAFSSDCRLPEKKPSFSSNHMAPLRLPPLPCHMIELPSSLSSSSSVIAQ